MRIHILGICGTFMAGIAVLARALGHAVSGSDSNVYPPMSTQLAAGGIALIEGYDPAQLNPPPDIVIVGNAMSRGNPCVEQILNSDLRFTSGPRWLHDEILRDRHVLAVSGTHGKTTTTSMLTWALETAGRKPGFLVGGVPANFGQTARLGDGRYFVIEADEYDTAFFDKRSKFIHYRPSTLIINNIEFDHADIFSDLAAIRREFHHMIRTLPGRGLIVAMHADPEIQKVLEMGCWTPVEYFGSGSAKWTAKPAEEDFSTFEIMVAGRSAGWVHWKLIGRHNAYNALAAAAAAAHIGISTGSVCAALTEFKGVKRRLECLACIHGISLYDDFAHHPTEIRHTLSALRSKVGRDRIIAIMEPRSNTMRMGVHQKTLAESFAIADRVLFLQPDHMDWDLRIQTESLGG
ncbi:MAG: UDP-N-acetylmuramate:L-alanyl-gamma-D-glutamyl-meso-diaminopimelate ligase, partial [Gammaproteobacteria bacterium]